MIEELTESINTSNFLDDINNLLIKEKIIEIKKKNNVKLSKDEEFFDKYLLRPSVVMKTLKGKSGRI